MNDQSRGSFWREALALQGAVTPRVTRIVLAFGVIAFGVCGLARLGERWFERRLELEITPFEFAGAALSLLLVFRTNAGYDRWWEARKLWGGFVDRCRNVMIGAMAYGPSDAAWRAAFARWVAAYPHVARHALRGELPAAEVERLLGRDGARCVAEAQHMPSFVALTLAGMLREARDRWGMDGFAFLQVDRERALLIDNYGGCERIRGTPMPKVFSLKIRHFLLLFLLALPLALLHRLGSDWLVPPVTMLVAYPLLSLDQIGVELENPFATDNLSHLPLDDLSGAMEKNALGLLEVERHGVGR